MKKIMLGLIFFCIVVTENIWFVNHSGPVGWISSFSIKHFGYWSGLLSYGLPVILGLFIFIITSFFILRDGEAKVFLLNAKSFSERMRLPIVLMVIGFEMCVLGGVRYVKARMVEKIATCSIEEIFLGTCPSRWVTVNSHPKPAGFSVQERNKIYHYIQPEVKYPIFVLMEGVGNLRDEHIDFPSTINGMLEDMDPGHFLFLKPDDFKFPWASVKVIKLNESPKQSMLSNLIQMVISGVMGVIGIVLFLRKRRQA